MTEIGIEEEDEIEVGVGKLTVLTIMQNFWESILFSFPLYGCM